ncbi:MAG: hypothetical protein JSU75_06140 [Gammaproteobacteria bacterium]|nr:MAG: hypothetical protein JSU75_06140 [Gammaproteobacteria bacterium]
MQSEIMFIVVLIAPWALVLAAVLFYRHRQARKTPGGTGGGRDGDDAGS